MAPHRPEGPEEGVIKFELRYTRAPPVTYEGIRELNAWRRILWKLGLIGQDPARYGGLGYGNVSMRLAAAQGVFVISGTQTGQLPELDAAHYTLVRRCDPTRNLIVATGPVRPSSESLTHCMLYLLDEAIRYVFHVHSPVIWRRSEMLDIPMTRADIGYGTPGMAQEVARLYRDPQVRDGRILSMGGHRDGVVTYGRTAEEAGTVMLRFLVRALQRE
jgi:hypothetical protein